MNFSSADVSIATAQDVPVLRRLVNAAYRELSDLRLNYTATYQDEEITRKRISQGRAFIIKSAESENEIMATILYFVKNFSESTKRLRRTICSRAALKKQGLGLLLMDYCENLARSEGFESLQLDTAKSAKHLVDWYLRLGYTIVGEMHWEGKTYDSFIFEKVLK